MITRDYLKKLGFKQDVRAPKGCEDYFIQIVGNGYVNIRFMQNEPDKVSYLYAYSENKHTNLRKVVLSETIVTKEDFESALKLCHIKL